MGIDTDNVLIPIHIYDVFIWLLLTYEYVIYKSKIKEK